MAELEHFRKLLAGISMPDNTVRQEAEKEYENIPMVNRISYLMNVLCATETEPELHQLSAILLRRIITSNFDETYPLLDKEHQAELKHQLLLSVQRANSSAVRKKIADCIAELARRLIDEAGKNQWPEVLKFMFDSVSSPDSSVKEIPLHMFCQFPGIFGQQQDHYQEVVRQMLGQCMQPAEPEHVRYAAACATIAFLLNNSENTQLLRHFCDLVPGVVQAAQESASKNEDTVLKSLVELCEDAPKVIRPHVEVVLTSCLAVVANIERDDSVRQLALETIVTLAETAPGMIRKQKTLIPMIVPQMLALMIDLDEDDDALAAWSVADDAEDDDCDANPVVGENAIDRFACALGGKTILPHIMSTIPPMLQNPDWRYRHAGLMAISAVGEGCHKYMEEILSQIVEAVLPFLRDPHPRVRYSSCNALGQMCTDFAPTMQKQYHAKIIPALCATLDDHANPRVQAHAGAALVNFVEDCPKNVLLPYLDPLCCKLEQVLSMKIQEKGTKLVLEQVTTTIAAVADTAEENFTNFYDRFMPSLKYIMQNAHSKEYRMLRGKTIECISLIGLAVGSDKFMPDAQDIMQHLLQTQADIESWEDDDPQISYMISAWARMCKLLGEKFVEYLPVVMGPLMKAAAIKPEVTMLDTQDVDAVDDDDGWEFIKLGDQQSFGIKTAGLEEKSTACQMLVCYARELKAGFVGYVEEVVKLMVPLLKFYFHDGVRSSAAESLPLLLSCGELRGNEYVQGIWEYIAPNMLAAIKDEPDKDVLSIAMESIAKCIEQRGRGCFTIEQYQELAATLHKMLEEHFQRADERHEKRNDEDYDEQVEEKLQEEDNEDVYILSKIADILHALFGTHHCELFPFFDSLLPHYVKLLGPERSWSDRQWALCVFDDVIEHTGADSAKYRDIFVRPMLTYIEDDSPEVRQAASYGIGVMAMHASDAYADVIKEAMPRLQRVIKSPRGRGSNDGNVAQDDVAPLENCISAVGKVLRHAPKLVGSDAEVSELLNLWLSWLPVTEDKEEATHVYEYLAELIETNNTTVLGDNNRNLPAVISLIADAIYGDALEESKSVADRLTRICKQVQVSANILWEKSVSGLPSPKQLALNAFLASTGA